MHHSNVYQRWAKYIDPVTGRRQDAAHKYIHSIPAVATAKNLHIVCNATVDRVIFTGNRITGVVYVPSGSNSPELTIRSRRLTIISAGASSTPQILERSGVGNPTLLSSLGIPTVIPLPGVGENLQDHHLICPVYRVASDTDTHDAIFTGNATDVPPYDSDIDDINVRGQWCSNGMDVAGKVRPHNPTDIGPVFARDVWDSEFTGKKSDRPVVVVVPING
jgi:alcohol oxidase